MMWLRQQPPGLATRIVEADNRRRAVFLRPLPRRSFLWAGLGRAAFGLAGILYTGSPTLSCARSPLPGSTRRAFYDRSGVSMSTEFVAYKAISNPNRLSDEAWQVVSAVVVQLHDLWKILDGAIDDDAKQVVACSLASELLPIAGARLDALLSSPTGCFEEVLERRGIAVTVPTVSH